jgi:DNA-binding CsgD family transcriptional regulator
MTAGMAVVSRKADVLRSGVTMAGGAEPTPGTLLVAAAPPPDAPAPSSPLPALLTPADIEYEIRRLITRLVAGSRLLRHSRGSDEDANACREVLLDLEVDGVRCLLTKHRSTGRSGVGRLTAREREVAQMVAMGLTNVAIAGKLDVSPWTVSTHLRRIFAKLDVPTRAAMVAVIADADGNAPRAQADAGPAEAGSDPAVPPGEAALGDRGARGRPA